MRSLQEREDCDALTVRRDRIKCRLKSERGEGYQAREYGDAIPEACVGLEGRRYGGCLSLYKSSEKCYLLEGPRKDRCFKQVVGFTSGKLKDHNVSDTARDEKVRNYLVTLLYDLQERVEAAHAVGGVSEVDASGIIDLIVEIKQDLLIGETREVVRPRLVTLRSLVKSVREAAA